MANPPGIPSRRHALRPTRLHIGSGKNYMPRWFNADIPAAAEPGALLDLSRPVEMPVRVHSDTVGTVELAAGSLELIYTNNVREHVADLTRLMTNCLLLLKEGGQMLVKVPYEHAPAAWQGPTRAAEKMTARSMRADFGGVPDDNP